MTIAHDAETGRRNVIRRRRRRRILAAIAADLNPLTFAEILAHIEARNAAADHEPASSAGIRPGQRLPGLPTCSDPAPVDLSSYRCCHSSLGSVSNGVV